MEEQQNGSNPSKKNYHDEASDSSTKILDA